MPNRNLHLSGYVNDIVLLIDERMRIVEANDRAAATYGYSQQELVRMSIEDLQESVTLPGFPDKWRTVQREGSAQFEARHRRKDGSLLTVEVSARLLAMEGGRFCQSVIRDITGRKRAEDDRRRLARALRVLSASNQAVIRGGDETCLYGDICGAITESGGYPLAWIGFAENDDLKSVRRIAASGAEKEYLDTVQVTWGEDRLGQGPAGRCIRTGQITILNDTESDPRFEPWREKTARYNFRSVVALPLRCEGSLIGALTIYAPEADAFQPDEMHLLEELAGDLSFGIEARRRRLEQARAENELLRSALEFRTLFESANDAIFFRDLEGRILEANHVACQQLGYSREELVGMTVMNIDSPTGAHGMLERIAKSAECGQALFETVHVRKDGSQYPVEISSRVFEYRGKPAVLSIARDISERKRAQAEAEAHTRELERAKLQAETANRAKSEFLANMSHEIRTPMNGIIGMSSLLMDTGLTAEQRGCVQSILESADSLLTIVNDILDLSRVEAGRMPLQPAGFDIVSWLAQTGESIAPRAREKGLQYVFEERVRQRWVYGDAGRLRQIVLNLLSNAIKFTDCGQITLRVSDSSSPEETETSFEISVADTGEGIAPDDLPLLFNKFTQLDSSFVKKHEGAGLGLSIARHLAELMRGGLTVTSELGRGSTFLLALALPVAAEAELGASPRDTPIEFPVMEGARKYRHVLLAEDNAVNRKIGLSILEKLGCRVDVAANGREAVAMATGFRYDLIFMDCGMPEMDGLAATREIRIRQPGFRTPIVAWTAHAVAGAREQCLGSGMDDYVSKPASRSTIQEMLSKWSPSGHVSKARICQ